MAQSASRQLDLNQLLVLRTVLATRNVTLAAERLHMSQPAVSRVLARLREVFRDPLFVKGARGVIPTPRAEALAASLTTLLESVDALVDAPVFDPRTTDRVFRIATTDYGALAVMPELAATLAEAAPLARIEVLPFRPEVFRSLLAGEVDLVLYSDDPVPDGLRTEPLFQETYTSLVRSRHPLEAQARSGRVPLDGFLAYPHILVTVLGGSTGVVDAALKARGQSRRVAMVLPYFATAAAIASRTDFILTLPDRAAAKLAGANALTRFKPPVETEGYGYQMVWHERTDHDPACLWLRRALAKPFTRD